MKALSSVINNGDVEVEIVFTARLSEWLTIATAADDGTYSRTAKDFVLLVRSSVRKLHATVSETTELEET